MKPDSKNKPLQPLGRILSITGKNYLRALNVKLAHLDLDRNYYALLLIGSAEREITQQELADLLEIDKVSMLRSIDYLSEKGYVNRVKIDTDRRKYSLELTAKARKALPEIERSYVELNKIAFNGISDAQIDDLLSKLKTIKNNLNEYSSNL